MPQYKGYNKMKFNEANLPFLTIFKVSANYTLSSVVSMSVKKTLQSFTP